MLRLARSGVLCALLAIGSARASPDDDASAGVSDAGDGARFEPAGDLEVDELTELGLDELLEVDVEVTSVSMKAEPLSETAAAAAVVTGEDIRRTGARTLPEALRYTPGVQVARINQNSWAVGARGFAAGFTKKLLTMIDGRSIYTPVFGGTYWDQHTTYLPDVDRIEVVRGPGGTIWGANAVAGVINVLTKRPRDTQGLHVFAGGGTEERAFGGARYGGALSDDAWFRVYAQYSLRDEGFGPGFQATDGWYHAQTGFRAEWEPTAGDLFELQGDLFGSEVGADLVLPMLSPPSLATSSETKSNLGANLLARWTRELGDRSAFSFQVWGDGYVREEAFLRSEVRTADISFEHRFPLPLRQEIHWGVGYRIVHDEFEGTELVDFAPPIRDYDKVGVFVQDEIELIEDTLRLTVGSKLEYNEFSGLELQPSGRLWWRVSERFSLWTAVSRAVRSPTRLDENSRVLYGVDPSSGLPLVISGAPSFEAEDLASYELGLRARPIERLSLDIATFFNHYEDLASLTAGAPDTSGPTPIIPVTFTNRDNADILGVEVGARAQILESVDLIDSWSVRAAYTWLHTDLIKDDPRNLDATGVESSTPRHQLAVRSTMDLPLGIALDVGLRWVDALDVGTSGYAVLDARVAWSPTDDLEIAVVGRDLLDSAHPEFDSTTGFIRPTETEHGVFGQITWTFGR